MRSEEHYNACERASSLLRWGSEDTLIDRHDARALLDESALLPRRAPRPLSDDARREEELAAFERWRDLVRLLRRGHGGEAEARGLALVAHEALQRRVDAVGHTAPTARDLKAAAQQPQQPGAFGAVPFAYGGDELRAEEPDGGEEDSDSDSADSDDSQDAQAAALAAACGIRDLGWHVRAEKRRRAEEAGRGDVSKRPSVKEV